MRPGMHRTWEFSHCDGFDCPYCGAVYAVRYTQLPVRDSESAYCENCHRRMSHWNSTEQPSYTLIERPPRDRVGVGSPVRSGAAERMLAHGLPSQARAEPFDRSPEPP